MKYLLLLLLILFNVKASSLETVKYVSPQKFSGLWYEIARTYNSFQDKCVASSVEYVLECENEYKVYNRCFDTKIGGELIEFSGSAEPTDGNTMSKIDMTYFWIFTKEYGVYYLEDDYTSALVADEKFEDVWIMSREPFLQEATLKKIEKILASKIDLKTLIYTLQDKEGRYK
ncbi:MAG: apolipoprotein D and lipocalin family protein [Sulfurimonas sp.]|jgi:apolipoprotein D and lipocalin family protein|uniref:lipocalin family protein n=1 Tax=Sulfurimonas sp. TaxID=2022749 RepID=UPI0039E59B4C